MTKVQSNGVNDNTDTRVPFTVQRRPYRSNRDAREMLYDVDHDDTNTDSVEDIKLCNYYHIIDARARVQLHLHTKG